MCLDGSTHTDSGRLYRIAKHRSLRVNPELLHEDESEAVLAVYTYRIESTSECLIETAT